MTATADSELDKQGPSDLKRSITGRLLFFYVLGDVLGSGIYVLIGLVAGAVGGAFWLAFAIGVTVATITGLAYAELVTKYPRAAGAALYVNKAFGNRFLTFLIAVCMLSACFAAAGSLATGFAAYFDEIWSLPPALLVSLAFVVVLSIVNYIGITESAVANMAMTFVEVAGLLIIMVIGIVYVVQGKADFSTLGDFQTDDNPVLAVVAGVALAFFAMTGFENAANVAEETVEPRRTFPRALVAGMVTAGVVYVLVAITAALVVPVSTLAGSDAALLEVVKADVLPFPVGFMTTLRGHPVAHPVRDGARGRRPRCLRPGPLGPAQPVGRPLLRRARGVLVADRRVDPQPGRRRSRRRRPARDRDRRLHALHLRPGDRVLPQAARQRRGRQLPRPDRPARRRAGRQHRAAGLRRVRRSALAHLVRRAARPRSDAVRRRAALRQAGPDRSVGRWSHVR
jgi:hypothetical protein